MILVLFAELGECVSALALRSLSDEELARAAAIRHAGERKLFVAGRHLLQTALAEVTGVERIYTVKQSGPGKPYLADGPGCLEFSISHSQNGVAAVVSTSGRVGLDIERVAELDPRSIESALTVSELASLACLPAAERSLATIRSWSEKEAVAKFHGAGPGRDGGQLALKSWTLEFGPEVYQLCLAHEHPSVEIILRKGAA